MGGPGAPYASHGGCGVDIAVGKDGSAWTVGCGANASVYRLNKVTNTWGSTGLPGLRLGVLNEISAAVVHPLHSAYLTSV